MLSRVREPELMDDPALDEAKHLAALDDLARANRISRIEDCLFKRIELAARAVAPQPLCVLDLATGSGDLPIALWQRCSAQGIAVELSASDISRRSIDYAGQRAKARGAEVNFFVLDAVHDPFPD